MAALTRELVGFEMKMKPWMATVWHQEDPREKAKEKQEVTLEIHTIIQGEPELNS
jgi:hypothetical protein